MKVTLQTKKDFIKESYAVAGEYLSKVKTTKPKRKSEKLILITQFTTVLKEANWGESI